ncbi:MULTISPECIES: phage antirepressor KilAC domain-containing protein [unclassified Acinetobacter]|uniref:phage antirepressor KilAC domain-containing protein n=1 Tax=unclassified Acinetobacter TaxID=196816 RepID=UPI002447214D|nr:MULTISPECIES: phage antirepressor KilAC domain-containing protein [unclassified Acinetobacter]MDH0031331.1 phage antirepressor KilAC domain-containing protein [Acinetobacter sp. GD04021]MDH0887184.1 phage antirepressor KilAC domain-containing protein [Acinetobacter sp. GD03873]MDH1083527.1 phage antirepressor KilAC domain-containing protein [Acinetobacter sp. GD03983]MDH2190500.1 phage antirepressor KilAC domain-containing protein [Acinetobacter sp. GD03645]MDH2204054.1 phage antirepressor 
MNAIVPLLTQSMTSLEISELVEKRHDNVKRTIETLAKSGVIQLPQIEDFEKINNLGLTITVKAYVFTGEQGKRDSIIVVAQLCPEFTARLVDRWQELEAQVAKPTDPMKLLADPHALRNALLTYSEKVIELEQKVEVMQPTIDAFDRIATADGSLCLTDAAKTLQQEPHKFNKWLNLNDWIYKRTGSKHWVAYQEKIKAGYLEHKVKDIPMPDGSVKISEQVRVTPKGLTRLSKLLGNNNV